MLNTIQPGEYSMGGGTGGIAYTTAQSERWLRLCPKPDTLMAMSLDTLIMFFGAFVAVLPFLGFPANWDRVLFLIAGLIIVALGIAVRRRMPRSTPRSFVETKPPQDSHTN